MPLAYPWVIVPFLTGILLGLLFIWLLVNLSLASTVWFVFLCGEGD